MPLPWVRADCIAAAGNLTQEEGIVGGALTTGEETSVRGKARRRVRDKRLVHFLNAACRDRT